MHFRFLDASEWHRLGSVDVLLGIRTFGQKKYNRKPPSKLINAWRAGIPFIGGADSAYTQVGTPGKDFLQVFSYDEMVDALIRLRRDPGLCEKIVEAGRKRAEDFTFDRVEQRWKSLLEVDIAHAYSQWTNRCCKPLRFAVKSLQYASFVSLKHGVKISYKLPLIKHLREHYYDPVQ
ncbi:MAG: glycosyltransferase [Verrucomicrobiota bacterium]